MGVMRRESERDGGGTYIMFEKNRNGNVGVKFGYQLENGSISYGVLREEVEEI
jgi:hypothetical protein